MAAEGGGERDPLMDHTDDRGDDDEGNETTGFDPVTLVPHQHLPLARLR